jgi:uncharacterized protein (DUF924 family)
VNDTTLDAEAHQLLEFWFGELSQGFADEAHRQRWFMGGPEFDVLCHSGFAALYEQAAAGELAHWQTTASGSLALILLCDQLPRNIFRNEAQAFITDPIALNTARTLVDEGLDQALAFDERAFCYLPFEHSESLLDQHTSVGLFTAMRDSTPQGQRHLTGGYLQHAHQHRDTIQRFSRFPFRNAALDRISTPAELDYINRT